MEPKRSEGLRFDGDQLLGDTAAVDAHGHLRARAREPGLRPSPLSPFQVVWQFLSLW